MNKNLNTEIGNRIRQLRETRLMTREQFSEQCNISESFLADIETGKKSFSTQTLYKICVGAKISPDYLIMGSDTSNDISLIEDLLKKLDAKYIPNITKIITEFINAVNAE